MLTPKQEAFCLAYIETGNASEAYRRAAHRPIKGRARFYTYFLIDPRDQSIFYVGKGTGNRVSQHVAAVNAGRVGNAAKCGRIFEIQMAGHPVTEVIFSNHARGDDAYTVERLLIERLREGITNIAKGQTTEAERASVLARICLSRMKPYTEWIATAGQSRIESATRLFGSPRACYDKITAEFQEFAHD